GGLPRPPLRRRSLLRGCLPLCRHYRLLRDTRAAVAVVQVFDVLVRAQGLQRGLAQQLLPADATIEDLDHHARRHPGRATQRGVHGVHVRGRLAAGVLRQARCQLAQHLVAEAGAYPADIAPAMLRIRPRQQQRAETGTAALRRGIADDGELVAGQLLGLAPVVATSRPVRAVGTLGDDTLEVALDRQRDRLAAITRDMRTVGQVRRALGQHFLQQFLACPQRRFADVHAVDMQQVEQHVGQRAGALAGQRGLQQVEVLASAVAGDQLAIQRRTAQAQRLHRVADLGDAVGPLQRIARPQPHLALLDGGEDAVAIPLDLVQPLLAFRRGLAQARQLRLKWTVGRIGGARPFQRLRALLPVLAPRAWSRHRGQALARGLAVTGALAVLRGRRRDLGQQVVGLQRAGPSILVLEQQPLRLPRGLAGSHQVPATLEPLAEQLEAQVALGELLLWITGGRPDTMVEAHDMAAAIFALGDLALEAGVVQRMVLDLHRHALDRRVVARPLRHR